MKVSIVFAYYNRKSLLLNTLKTIEYYNKDRNIEVIIVDDASNKDQDITDFPEKFQIPILIIPLTKEEKTWTNPCIPYNIGFSFVTGDVVIIQNPENIHCGDIVKYAIENIKENDYLSFGCYSLNQGSSNKLNSILSMGYLGSSFIKKAVDKFEGKKDNWKDGDNCWYNHSQHNPGAQHFCSAIMAKDLKDLSGFDERYSNGLAFDDSEFNMRIRRKGMNIRFVDDPFVIHQFHTASDYVKNNEGYLRNKDLYINHTSRESFYKAARNKYYYPEVPARDNTWHLKKIPKILHVYFGGVNLSYLRYLTITSFMRLNPEWEVIFYYPKYPTKDHTWTSPEQHYADNWEDYTPHLKKLLVKRVEIDSSIFGMPNSMSEVHKSDILRWHLLSVIGGLWCDMDILYFRPITCLAINIPANKKADTVVCISAYGHSVGFMMGSAGNRYYEALFRSALKKWDKNDYQCVTAPMCNSLFPTIASIKSKMQELNPINLGMEAVYLYNATQIAAIFNSSICPTDNLNSIGCHWYAGSPIAGRFMSETNGGFRNSDSMIGRLVQEEKKHPKTGVGVIVVNLNQLILTKKCIGDLLCQTNRNFEIFLFDQNSSEKGTTEFLIECESNGINVFRNKENVPLNHIWSNFRNICFNEYLCFLNNDTELSNRFIDDTIKVFKADPLVGFAIHVTNHPLHLHTKPELEYKILDPPYYQGWDFTIKRSVMPNIPEGLKVYGGDDYVFAKVVNDGHDIALVYSSPIIHHGNKTSETIKNIKEIESKDSKLFYKILKEEKLKQIDITTNKGLCYMYPTKGMKIISA